MRYIITLIFILLFTSNEVSGQTTWHERIIDLKLGSSVQFLIDYDLNEKYSVGIGQGIQIAKERLKIDDLPYHSDLVFFHIYDFYNVEVPIFLKRTLGHRFFIQGGASFQVSLGKTEKIVHYRFSELYSSKEIHSWNESSRVHILGNLGLGFDFYRNDEISLFILPLVQYSLTESKIDNLSVHPLTLGLSLGLRLNLVLVSDEDA